MMANEDAAAADVSRVLIQELRHRLTDQAHAQLCREGSGAVRARLHYIHLRAVRARSGPHGVWCKARSLPRNSVWITPKIREFCRRFGFAPRQRLFGNQRLVVAGATIALPRPSASDRGGCG